MGSYCGSHHNELANYSCKTDSYRLAKFDILARQKMFDKPEIGNDISSILVDTDASFAVNIHRESDLSISLALAYFGARPNDKQIKTITRFSNMNEYQEKH